MGQIIKNSETSKIIKKLKSENKRVILVGGCFDILHKGHKEFIDKSKNLGGVLVVMLESDQKVKELKGNNRPLNSQSARAEALKRLSNVDYVLNLPYLKNEYDYKMLVKQLKPDIIAVTAGEKVFYWEKTYMNNTSGKIVEVIDRLPDYSTTKLAGAQNI